MKQTYERLMGCYARKINYIRRSLIGRFREKKQDLLMVYLDIKKAYDRITKEVIWHSLEKKSVQRQYIDAVKSMYNWVIVVCKNHKKRTNTFPITIGLLGTTVPWCIFFANDSALVHESTTRLNYEIESSREAQESKASN